MLDYAQLRESLLRMAALPADAAKALLLDPTTPAAALYPAALAFYGPTVVSYEPDTLWTTLDVPEGNRDKLMAAFALQTYPSFYWDLRVFGHTCLAFADQAVHTELTPQPMPEHIIGGVYEAQILFQIDTDVEPEFDDDVAAYVAACLAHEGLVYAPPVLSFAEEHLERILSPEGRELGQQVKKMADEEHPKADTESALGVQLARYLQLGDYLEARMKRIKQFTSSGRAR